MVGQVVGHDRMLDTLGAGDLGSAGKAQDQRLERLVALKILRAHLMGDDSVLAAVGAPLASYEIVAPLGAGGRRSLAESCQCERRRGPVRPDAASARAQLWRTR